MLPVIAMLAMATASMASAPKQQQSFGQWRTYIVLEGAPMQRGWANTEQDLGTVFGLACGQVCKYYLVSPTPCAEGTEYKALAANRTESGEIRLRCMHLDVVDGLIVQDDASIERLLVGDTISFAVPLGDGKFNISRFSLNGAKQAIATVVGHWKQEGGSAHAPDDDSKVPDQKLNDTTL